VAAAVVVVVAAAAVEEVPMALKIEGFGVRVVPS